MTIRKIAQKWGFGMAPVKENMDHKRKLWIQNLCALIIDGQINDDTPDCISEVKGLFNRIVKQDQWDWFVVFDRMGRPGRKKCQKLVHDLRDLRNSVVENDMAFRAKVIDRLMDKSILRHLELYVSGEMGKTVGHHTIGQIYILSTREQRDILKIGYTTRSIYRRVDEINAATGVVVPYGVRAVWCVKNAPEMEKEIHSIFRQYRVRNDREFFSLDFKKAFEEIMNHIKRSRTQEL